MPVLSETAVREAAAEPERSPTARARARRPDAYAVAVLAIAALQAVVFGSLCAAGYFYLDDLDNLARAGRSPLGWDYLSLRLNDHFTPGLRLAYWVFAHVAPFDHGFTVGVRVGFQVAATVLMGVLLRLLVGRRPAALAGVALYALSPLLLPSFLSLSSAVNLLPTHVGVLVLLIGHVRYEATRRLRWTVVGAAGLAVSLLFWEKSVLAVGLLPLLTVLHLSTGGVRQRLRAFWRSWPAWLVAAVPAVAFFGFYLTAGYPSSGSTPRPAAVAELVGTAWLRSVAPSLVGGPWQWLSNAQVYFSVADPNWVGIVAAQVIVAALLLAGIRRTGWGVARAWALPVAYLLVNMVILAAGRFEYYGTLVATNFHYLSDLTIPLVLAVVLSLVPADVTRSAERGTGPVFPRGARARLGVAALVVAYLTSFTGTAAAFADRWTQNPTRPYLTALVDGLNRDEQAVHLYDTTVSTRVLNIFASDRRVSEVLSPLHPRVAYDDASAPMSMVDDDGRIVPAEFTADQRSTEQAGVFCSHPLRGAGELVVPLTGPAPPGRHFVRFDHLSQRPSAVEVLLGSGDRLVAPYRGAEVSLGAPMGTVVVQTAQELAVDRIVLRSANPNVSVCVTKVELGFPAPERP